MYLKDKNKAVKPFVLCKFKEEFSSLEQELPKLNSYEKKFLTLSATHEKLTTKVLQPKSYILENGFSTKI